MDKCPLGVDSEVHELILGSSFDTKDQEYSFHSIRYDFKPASVDTNQVASVEIGKGNEVTVSVPHVEGAGTSQTVYRGNKRPCQKDCVLIIDNETGEIRLEKLTNSIQLKKTRSIPGSNRAQAGARPSTPVEQQTTKTRDPKTSPGKTRPPPKPSLGASRPSPSPSPVLSESVPTPPSVESKNAAASEGNVEYMSASSSGGSESDSTSGSDSEPEPEKPPPTKTNPVAKVAHDSSSQLPRLFMSTLCEDLQLSESGSDSD